MNTYEPKIKWQLVDRDVFAEFRFATADEIAQAYFDESMLDNANDVRLVSLYEIGQGRFSERWNNRQARERLFFNLVNNVYVANATKVGA